MMKKTIIYIVLLALTVNSYAQTGIGTKTPHTTAALEIKSITKGFLGPRMTEVQRNTILTPATGLLIYQTDVDPGFYYFDGSTWLSFSSVRYINNLQDAITSATNLFMGEGTGFGNASSDNLGIGLNTLANTTGGNSQNIAIGNNAMEATSSLQSIALGLNTLQNSITSFRVIALGNNAGNNASNLFYSIAVGTDALSNGSGSRNLAVGDNALNGNTGNDNIAMGYNAVSNNTSGINNIGIGTSVLLYNTTGNSNTAVGSNTLAANTTGNSNTAVGNNAFSSGTSFNNSTAIGADAQITQSNEVRLGNNAVTKISAAVTVITTSDARIKDNVIENIKGLEFITKLRPVSYNLNLKKQSEILGTKYDDSKGKYNIEKIRYSGFLAQEVEKAAIETNYNFSGIKTPKHNNDLYQLSYSEFVVPLVKAVQEQQEQLKLKNEEIKTLNKRLNALEKALEKLIKK